MVAKVAEVNNLVESGIKKLHEVFPKIKQIAQSEADIFPQGGYKV